MKSQKEVYVMRKDYTSTPEAFLSFFVIALEHTRKHISLRVLAPPHHARFEPFELV